MKAIVRLPFIRYQQINGTFGYAKERLSDMQDLFLTAGEKTNEQCIILYRPPAIGDATLRNALIWVKFKFTQHVSEGRLVLFRNVLSPLVFGGQ